MSSRMQKKDTLKAKKPTAKGSEGKDLDQTGVLLKEILAMGGSKQDLELLNGIDSDSDIEDIGGIAEEAQGLQKQLKQKTAASKPQTELAEEPKLKSEVANFMKSLFGSALMDHKNMELAAEEEEDEDVDQDDKAMSDDDGEEDCVSEGSWETEDDEDKDTMGDEDHSGDDSMDDLPQELRDINAQLEGRKRKLESISGLSAAASTPSKKTKSEVSGMIPAKKLQPGKNVIVTSASAVTTTSKAKGLSGKSEAKGGLKGNSKSAPGKAKPVAAVKPKSKNSAGPSKIASSLSKTATWKLGDGWSKGFEDEIEDDNSVKSKRNTQKKKAHQQQPQQQRKGRGALPKTKK